MTLRPFGLNKEKPGGVQGRNAQVRKVRLRGAHFSRIYCFYTEKLSVWSTQNKFGVQKASGGRVLK